ncbi:MAG: prepilin-type N-terminal cleavage/methylation domain-containing protein [Pontiella sp.]
MKNDKKGFTLVEIIIAVAIMGLLASAGGVVIHKSVTHARIKAAESELAIYSCAVLQLAWDTGKWPNGEVRTQAGGNEVWDLSSEAAGLMVEGSDNVYPNWNGPYYEGVTEDPWGNSYFFDPDYRIDGVMRIVIGSLGPNGVGRNVYEIDNIYILLDD